MKIKNKKEGHVAAVVKPPHKDLGGRLKLWLIRHVYRVVGVFAIIKSPERGRNPCLEIKNMNRQGSYFQEENTTAETFPTCAYSMKSLISESSGPAGSSQV